MNDKDMLINRTIICAFRYALTRDNHLMPSGFFSDFKQWVPQLVEDSKKYLARKLIDEIGFFVMGDDLREELIKQWLEFEDCLKTLLL